ncbi:ABC transporter ATP-binding protein [Noviherbaspirillum sp. Root189]|uniref:ABC transporter ATP-binding protein n=1 Tax=Noviherbaspirillum sp. Root189 TaxID=1736487 RepID=UPI0007097CBD|nr:ABC transporter ATP-binding protein [Noviherbaspirillum sp. Root189]KRB70561.1 ABC transporter ATP-binding protein [Noviherbaspirillum sp. Root189]
MEQRAVSPRSQPLFIQGLNKSFGNRKALDNISLSVFEGEFVALLGPNGAGKTTLFQILSGLFTADAGGAAVFGAEISTAPLPALAQIGIVFQQPAIDLDLSVRSNLQFQADLHGIARADARHRIAHWLGRFGLADRAGDPVRALSGGNRRRVELARALLSNPRLLLMDEATVGIDPASRIRILSDVHALCHEQGLGVLWATHLVDEAEAADRIVVLSKGQIRFDGTPVELKGRRGHGNMTDAFLELTQ